MKNASKGGTPTLWAICCILPSGKTGRTGAPADAASNSIKSPALPDFYTLPPACEAASSVVRTRGVIARFLGTGGIQGDSVPLRKGQPGGQVISRPEST